MPANLDCFVDARLGLTFVIESGDGDRFARLFRRAWRRIPKPVRQELWRQLDDDGAIVLAEEWDSPGPPAEGVLWGECMPGGKYVCFKASIIDKLPGRLVQDLVAHELAHVLMARLDQAGWSINWEKNEVLAEAFAEGWGFETEGLRRWESE